MSQPVSAAVITYNAASYIARCLQSLTWVDEIVVVDAESEDETSKICQDPTAPWANKLSFHTRAWTGFKDQRNFSLQKAKNNWILVVDADEECSPELAKKIQELLSEPNGPKHRAYKVRRIEYFLGKPISYGIWNPSYQDRFFHREGVEYTNDVHEYPLFPSLPQKIHEPLHHWPSFTPEKFLSKMNHYTSIEAKDRFDRGQRTNAFRLFFAFPAMFLKNFFYYGAYKDGVHGFVISLLEGVSRVVRHIKIWQLSQKRDL